MPSLYLPQCLCTCRFLCLQCFPPGYLQGSLPQSLHVSAQETRAEEFQRNSPGSLPKRDLALTHNTLQSPDLISLSLLWHLSSLVTSYLCICLWLASLHQDASPMRKEMIFLSTAIFLVPEILILSSLLGELVKYLRTT